MLQHWALLCKWHLQDQDWKILACGMDHCFRGHRQPPYAAGGNASPFSVRQNGFYYKNQPFEMKFLILHLSLQIIPSLKCSQNRLKVLLHVIICCLVHATPN